MVFILAKPRVMIIEDDAITALELQNKLEMWGYEVPLIASYGKEAIEMLERNDVDLILADIAIKGDIDGIDAVKMIKEYYAIPVLFISAHADDETFQRAKEAKPSGYVLKPIDERELKFNIEIALGKGEPVDDDQKYRERLKAINLFMLSTLPALSSNLHIEDTAIFLNTFARFFEANVKPQMLKDLGNSTEVPGSEGDELFDNYLKWISKFFSDLGYHVQTDSDELHVNRCIWGSLTADNKILCLICRAMAELTLRWTDLDGRMEHEYRMGINPPHCRFKYIFH